jgi:hypothetical protein
LDFQSVRVDKTFWKITIGVGVHIAAVRSGEHAPTHKVYPGDLGPAIRATSARCTPILATSARQAPAVVCGLAPELRALVADWVHYGS